MAARAPAGLNAAAKRLWNSIAGVYDLRPDELRILEDACNEAQIIDVLQREMGDPGHENIVKGSMGQPVASPLLTEIRQHRTTLKALLAQLKLPDDNVGAGSPRAVQARDAAAARWSRGA